MNLLEKYKPQRLRELRGQAPIVKALAKFAQDPYPAAFVFAGGTGVGKTVAAHCLAAQLGCILRMGEFSGVLDIPSGAQDGKAVEDLIRRLHYRPMYGSGWRVAIINEADRMTAQAEVIWLDALERLPAQSLVVFTTNDLQKLTDRLLHRCEVYAFEDRAARLRPSIVALARHVWKGERGRTIKRVAAGLGVYDSFSGAASFRLALQQLAPIIRRGEAMPQEIRVPMMRTEDPFKAAARKAVETRRRNQQEAQHNG